MYFTQPDLGYYDPRRNYHAISGNMDAFIASHVINTHEQNYMANDIIETIVSNSKYKNDLEHSIINSQVAEFVKRCLIYKNICYNNASEKIKLKFELVNSYSDLKKFFDMIGSIERYIRLDRFILDDKDPKNKGCIISWNITNPKLEIGNSCIYTFSDRSSIDYLMKY